MWFEGNARDNFIPELCAEIRASLLYRYNAFQNAAIQQHSSNFATMVSKASSESLKLLGLPRPQYVHVQFANLFSQGVAVYTEKFRTLDLVT